MWDCKCVIILFYFSFTVETNVERLSENQLHSTRLDIQFPALVKCGRRSKQIDFPISFHFVTISILSTTNSRTLSVLCSTLICMLILRSCYVCYLSLHETCPNLVHGHFMRIYSPSSVLPICKMLMYFFFYNVSLRLFVYLHTHRLMVSSSCETVPDIPLSFHLIWYYQEFHKDKMIFTIWLRYYDGYHIAYDISQWLSQQGYIHIVDNKPLYIYMSIMFAYVTGSGALFNQTV